MSNQYPPNPQQPFRPEHDVVGNSPLNPNHPSSAAYQGQQRPYIPNGTQIPQPKKKHTLRNVLIGAGAGLVVILGAAGVGGAGDPAGSPPPAVVTPVDNGPTPDPITTPTNKPTPPAATKTAPAPKPTKTAPALTASQEQAIGSAEDYLSTGAFSKSGLIDQLVFEGFSKADAKFAVAHITVNWNEQAALSAKSYLETSHFSRSGLIDQLEFEGFTHAQAVYGVNKAGL